METGRIKWFSNTKGYGFIQTESGKDVFVHYSSIQMDGYKSLDKGDKVEFELLSSEKGEQAQNVQIVEKAPKRKATKE